MATTIRTVYFPYKFSPTIYYVVRIELEESKLKGPLSLSINSPRFETCAGNIREGTVREIRRYTLTLTTGIFQPAYTNQTSLVVGEGKSLITPTIPAPATVITFGVNQPITITKERRLRTDPLPDPLPEDKKELQNIYYVRNPITGFPITVTYDAFGDITFDVYGSWGRALDQARHKIFTDPDVLIGTYRYYHSNGYLWKQQSYIRIGGDSVLHGPFTEYFDNGNVRVEARFISDRLDGFYREYYYEGLVKCQGTLINGKLEGEYTQWNEVGDREFKIYYVNGTLNNSYVLDYTS